MCRTKNTWFFSFDTHFLVTQALCTCMYMNLKSIKLIYTPQKDLVWKCKFSLKKMHRTRIVRFLNLYMDILVQLNKSIEIWWTKDENQKRDDLKWALHENGKCIFVIILNYFTFVLTQKKISCFLCSVRHTLTTALSTFFHTFLVLFYEKK
jgi:hypothetical protein